ncbi:MAG TPA: hypothetical protein VM711_10395, partial [Sphingomicrobium sp.]|nr:hypothetical protein [Sphingomicrobium sp.]
MPFEVVSSLAHPANLRQIKKVPGRDVLLVGPAEVRFFHRLAPVKRRDPPNDCSKHQNCPPQIVLPTVT